MTVKHLYLIIAPFYLVSTGFGIATIAIVYDRTYNRGLKITQVCYSSAAVDDPVTGFAMV